MSFQTKLLIFFTRTKTIQVHTKASTPPNVMTLRVPQSKIVYRTLWRVVVFRCARRRSVYTADCCSQHSCDRDKYYERTRVPNLHGAKNKMQGPLSRCIYTAALPKVSVLPLNMPHVLGLGTRSLKSVDILTPSSISILDCTSILVVAQAHHKTLFIYVIPWLLLGHRVVGSDQQKKHETPLLPLPAFLPKRISISFRHLIQACFLGKRNIKYTGKLSNSSYLSALNSYW